MFICMYSYMCAHLHIIIFHTYAIDRHTCYMITGFKRKLSSLTSGFKNSSRGLMSKSASIDELKKNKENNGRCKYVLDICMYTYVFLHIYIDY